MDSLVEFQTLETLVTWLGASTVTMAVVQIFKAHVKLDPRIFAYLIGFVIVGGANALLLVAFDVRGVLSLLLVSAANAALVALGAIGEHQILQKVGLLK